jgi:hypothetical protein
MGFGPLIFSTGFSTEFQRLSLIIHMLLLILHKDMHIPLWKTISAAYVDI